MSVGSIGADRVTDGERRARRGQGEAHGAVARTRVVMGRDSYPTPAITLTAQWRQRSKTGDRRGMSQGKVGSGNQKTWWRSKGSDELGDGDLPPPKQ
jgi:hypothetical protein